MAITRTVITDDDGTGTTGTVINNAWKVELYNQIDAQAHPRLLVDQVDITTTGTVNDHNPGSVAVRCNNATALTITGRVPYADGEIVIYENVGTSTVTFTHQGAGSTAANRFLLPAATAGQVIGAEGSIGFKYDGTSDRWRVLFVRPGQSITYTPTWTNGVIGNGTLTGKYSHVGMDAKFEIHVVMGSTTTFGGGAEWSFSLPLTASDTNGACGSVFATDTGTAYYIGAWSQVSTTVIRCAVNAASAGFTSTSPHTWANTDILRTAGSYRAA